MGTDSSGNWLNTEEYFKCCVYSGSNDMLLFWRGTVCQKQVFCSQGCVVCGGISSSPVLFLFWLIKLELVNSNSLFLFFFSFHCCADLLQFI